MDDNNFFDKLEKKIPEELLTPVQLSSPVIREDPKSPALTLKRPHQLPLAPHPTPGSGLCLG